MMQKRILSLLLVLTLLLGTIVPAASAADDPKPELTGWMEITGYEKQSTREPVRVPHSRQNTPLAQSRKQ